MKFNKLSSFDGKNVVKATGNKIDAYDGSELTGLKFTQLTDIGTISANKVVITNPSGTGLDYLNVNFSSVKEFNLTNQNSQVITWNENVCNVNHNMNGYVIVQLYDAEGYGVPVIPNYIDENNLSFYMNDKPDDNVTYKLVCTTCGYSLNEEYEDNVAVSYSTGIGNIIGGYTVPIATYEEITSNNVTTYNLLFMPPPEYDVDWSKFEVGQKIYISLCNTTNGLTEYIEAEIATIDTSANKITLTESIYGSDTTSSTTIGMIKKTVSGYTASATGGYSSYRVTLNGASNDDELYEGRTIYTRSGTGALSSNSISGVSGNYIYLVSAASGINAIYIPPTYNFITDAIADIEEPNHAAGEYNMVTGYDSFATGSFNTVNGDHISVSGSLNNVIGSNNHVVGNNNKVNGVSACVFGTSNEVRDGLGFIMGDQNQVFRQGAFILGDMNRVFEVNCSAFGDHNTLKAYGALAVGTRNTISGKYSVSVGYSNNVSAKSAYVIGRYANVPDYAYNKNAFIVWGGESQNNSEAFSVRVFREELNPLYNSSSLWAGYNGTEPNPKDSTGENKYNSVPAYRVDYKGQIKPKTQVINVSGTQNITLDPTMFSRVRLTGSGTVSLDIENYIEEGDKIELVVDTTNITLEIPSEWISVGADNIISDTHLYVIEIAMIADDIYYRVIWSVPSN